MIKVNIKIECTPEEAIIFLGIPDIVDVNEAYINTVINMIQGGGNIDQIQKFIKQMVPMGAVGLKLFQNFLDQADIFNSIYNKYVLCFNI